MDQSETMTVQCPNCLKQFDVVVQAGSFTMPVHSGRILKTCMAGGREFEVEDEEMELTKRFNEFVKEQP